MDNSKCPMELPNNFDKAHENIQYTVKIESTNVLPFIDAILFCGFDRPP